MPVFCAEFTLVDGPEQRRVRGPVDAETAEAAQQVVEDALCERGLNADSEITVTVVPTFQLTWKEAGTGRRDPKVIQEEMLAMTAEDAVREFAATHGVSVDEVDVVEVPDDISWEVVAEASESLFAANPIPLTPVGEAPASVQELVDTLRQIQAAISGLENGAHAGEPPSQKFWDEASRHQKAMMRRLMHSDGYRVKVSLLHYDNECFQETPATAGAVSRALNRLNDRLNTTAKGWFIERSANLDASDADVWLISPNTDVGQN